jgi:diguanylate cyclase (GGDEF)-like protein
VFAASRRKNLTRFGRRLFSWFVLATALPVILLGAINYLQAQHTLRDDTQHELRRVAKTIGMYLYAKLEELDEALGRMNPGDAAVAEISGVRRTVQLQTPQIAMARQAAVGPKGAVLFTQAVDSGRIEVALVPSRWRAHYGLQYAVVLTTEHLQAPAELLPIDVRYCLTDAAATPVACGRPPPAKALASATGAWQQTASGAEAWSDDTGSGIVAHWSVFLRGRFATADWLVVASRDDSDIYAPLAWYRTFYPRVLLAAVLLAMLLAFVQLRQRLAPLQKLVEATQRFGKGEYTARVQVQDAADEIGLLGEAFNDMAARTNQQFKRLAGLAELDRRILCSSQEEQIIDLTLDKLRELIGCRQVRFLSRKGNKDAHCPAPLRGASCGATDPGDQAADLILDDWSQRISGPVSLLAPVCHDSQRMRDEVPSTLFPVCHQDTCFGAIQVSWASPRQQMDFGSILGEFATRLAVALSNAAWEGALYHQAHYDPLTGLANRTLLTDRLEQALLRAARNSTRCAVLFIDLDGFKTVNDTLGHHAGDGFLKSAGERLREVTRASDSVVRFGGDEFVVLVCDLPADGNLVADLTATANRYIGALSTPIDVQGRAITLGASVGIAVYPDDGGNAGELLRNADAAMYHAKAQGRGHAEFYAERMNRDALERMALQQDLARAIRNPQELFLEFQPQISSATRQLTGIEALVRWDHPERGLIRPDQFVSLAEESNLIVPLGEWVLREACGIFRTLRGQGLAIPRLAVNVSPAQFWTDDFFDVVQRSLRDTGMSADLLELEVTEGTVMRDPDRGIEVLTRLNETGVRLTVDDFGTGYSSLSYLQRLPLHALKIDRSFVNGLGDGGASDAIVAAIIALGQRLGLALVAEGVESEAQVAALRELGCQELQGFLFGRPLGVDALADWCRQVQDGLPGTAAG